MNILRIWNSKSECHIAFTGRPIKEELPTFHYKAAYTYHEGQNFFNHPCPIVYLLRISNCKQQQHGYFRKGSRHGNCGYNRLNKSYIPCVDEDVICGMLHCSHLNEKLEFGMESVAILSHSFINSKGKIIACRSALVDLGLEDVDPGLAPEGARCGEDKLCVNRNGYVRILYFLSSFAVHKMKTVLIRW